MDNSKAPQYKKYRIFMDSNAGSYFVAASDSVNSLAQLTKYWLETTNVGMYLPDTAGGTLTIQQLDEVTGAYKGYRSLEFRGKDNIMKTVRLLGAR